MSLDKITDYDTTPSDNVDVGGVAITGASSIRLGNDAIQTMMSQLAKVNAGTDPVADTWTFGDPSDLTKRVRLDAGGVTAGQTRVLAAPDHDGTITTTSRYNSGDIGGLNLTDTPIPAWANVIVVNLNNVACATTGSILLQLGDAGGVEASGYTGGITIVGVGNTALSSWFALTGDATAAFNGVYTLSRKNTTTWTLAGQGAFETNGVHALTSGRKSTSETTDTLRVRCGGSVLFSAGGEVIVNFYS